LVTPNDDRPNVTWEGEPDDVRVVVTERSTLGASGVTLLAITRLRVARDGN
jgi:hypothetical protein